MRETKRNGPGSYEGAGRMGSEVMKLSLLMEKAGGRGNLVPVKRQVTRNGRSFMQTVWVKPDQAHGGGARAHSFDAGKQAGNGNGGADLSARADAKRQYDEVVDKYTNADGTKKAGWMKTPGGRETKLAERQWVQIRTPNFKKWFGDWENDPENASRVVDENGEPRIVAGMFVKSDNNAIDRVPKFWRETYDFGRKIREEHKDWHINQLWKAIVYDQIKVPDYIKQAFDGQGEEDSKWAYDRLEVLEMGFREEKPPRFVFAERVGKVPERGRSRNYREHRKTGRYFFALKGGR